MSVAEPVLLVMGGALALVYPLVEGRQLGWPWWNFALMLANLALPSTAAVRARAELTAHALQDHQ